MPLFMEVQTFGRLPVAGDLARLLEEQLGADGNFGVGYLRCWVSEAAGKVFRLVEADDPGLLILGRGAPSHPVAHEIYPVSEHLRLAPGRGPANPAASLDERTTT